MTMFKKFFKPMEIPQKFIEPIKFPEHNRELGAPLTMPECKPLPVWTDSTVCISCWKVPFWLRIKVLFTGKIWLFVYGGKTQPPVSIEINHPFYQTIATP